MFRRYTRAITVPLLAALLAACGQSSPDEPFDNYLVRLARALDVVVSPSAAAPEPAPPRAGALQITLEDGSLDTLDFLALHGCALQVNIGRKNSSLGRLARPSQTLLLELEFLRLAPDCIMQLQSEGRTALAQQLAAAQQLKITQLPARIFNATLGSDEYRAFWRGKRRAGEFPAVPDAVTLQALHAINAAVTRWLAGAYGVDGFEFELLLSEVAGGNGGELLNALQRQAHWLAVADGLLQARHARGPLCGPNLRHSAADILPNVVEKYFVEALQPGAAALHRNYHELLPAVRHLEELLEDTLPDAFTQWRSARNAVLSRGSKAPRQHVEHIQALLAPCQ
ncbi:MAG: DUF3080 family protein [Halioglobus sp.]|nr:DUF3080 family protein [Halioglobus sp.]